MSKLAVVPPPPLKSHPRVRARVASISRAWLSVQASAMTASVMTRRVSAVHAAATHEVVTDEVFTDWIHASATHTPGDSQLGLLQSILHLTRRVSAACPPAGQGRRRVAGTGPRARAGVGDGGRGRDRERGGVAVLEDVPRVRTGEGSLSE